MSRGTSTRSGLLMVVVFISLHILNGNLRGISGFLWPVGLNPSGNPNGRRADSTCLNSRKLISRRQRNRWFQSFSWSRSLFVESFVSRNQYKLIHLFSA